MTDKITVTKKEITVLAKKAGEWAITKEAEDCLNKLGTIKQWVEDAIEKVKSDIIETLSKSDPDTKTIRGKNWTAFIRSWGEKYKKVSNIDGIFLNEVKYYKINEEAVEDYKKKIGKLPEGVMEKAQQIKCSFRKKQPKS